jgi:transcription elongation factor
LFSFLLYHRSVKSERTIFKRNQFARIKIGAYKGDLCQIMQVLNGGTSLVVTMVPRINFQLLALPKDQRPKGFAAGIASGGPGGGKGSRAPQRFFDKDEIIEASNGTAVIETRTKYGLRLDVMGTNQYYNGMLIKEVKAGQVTAYGPPPTLEEISRFRGAAQKESSSAADEDGENEGGSNGGGHDAEEALLQAITSAKQAGVGIAGINTGTSSSSSSATSGPVAGSGNAPVGGQGAGGSLLLPGDSVVVVKGDLEGLSGKVVVLNGSTFTLQPSAESAAVLGLTERLEIPCDEAMKTFNIGDHVKAIGGLYIGETGTVIALKHVPAPSNSNGAGGNNSDSAATATWLATILLDSGTMKQVQAFVRDLTKSTDVVTSSASYSVEGYELHDLVELDSTIGAGDGPDGSNSSNTDAGVIIALGQRDVTVLMTTGIARTVRVEHLRGKINARSQQTQATDILGQALEVGDVVKVQQGGDKDRTGTIKHIYKIHLFLHDYTRPMHSGMFVARSRMCVLAGTRVKAPGTIPASNSGGAAAFGGAGRGQPMMARGGGPGFIRRPAVDDFAGATVRVTKGPHKGKIGIVKSMTFSHVAVEMHSGLKTISFPRDQVMKVEARVSGDAFTRNGGVAPFAQLPGPSAAAAAGVAGGPGMGGQTPFIGGGGATPAYGLGGGHYGGAMGGATPAYGLGGATPAFGLGGATPGYGAAAGGLGGQTPGYGAGIGGQTPGYSMGGAGAGGAAPGGAYGGQTPMYGGSKTPVYGAGPAGFGGEFRGPILTKHEIRCFEAVFVAENLQLSSFLFLLCFSFLCSAWWLWRSDTCLRGQPNPSLRLLFIVELLFLVLRGWCWRGWLRRWQSDSCLRGRQCWRPSFAPSPCRYGPLVGAGGRMRRHRGNSKDYLQEEATHPIQRWQLWSCGHSGGAARRSAMQGQRPDHLAQGEEGHKHEPAKAFLFHRQHHRPLSSAPSCWRALLLYPGSDPRGYRHAGSHCFSQHRGRGHQQCGGRARCGAPGPRSQGPTQRYLGTRGRCGPNKGRLHLPLQGSFRGRRRRDFQRHGSRENARPAGRRRGREVRGKNMKWKWGGEERWAGYRSPMAPFDSTSKQVTTTTRAILNLFPSLLQMRDSSETLLWNAAAAAIACH